MGRFTWAFIFCAVSISSDCGNFLAAIRANPDDRTARLVFADFLRDQGDPRSLMHEELIRACVAKSELQLNQENYWRESERAYYRIERASKNLPIIFPELDASGIPHAQWILDLGFVRGLCLFSSQIGVRGYLSQVEKALKAEPLIHQLTIKHSDVGFDSTPMIVGSPTRAAEIAALLEHPLLKRISEIQFHLADADARHAIAHSLNLRHTRRTIYGHYYGAPEIELAPGELAQ